MSDTITLHKDVIKVLFEKLIDTQNVNIRANVKHITELLANSIPDNALEGAVHLMLLDEPYKKVNVGDYVRFTPPNYHSGSEYEIDILNDMGLMHSSGDVYGIVMGDTSWSSNKKYNPFHSSIKIDILYHNGDREIKRYEHTINPLYVKRTRKSDIPYYKLKNSLDKINNNGKTINGSNSIVPQEVSES